MLVCCNYLFSLSTDSDYNKILLQRINYYCVFFLFLTMSMSFIVQHIDSLV